MSIRRVKTLLNRQDEIRALGDVPENVKLWGALGQVPGMTGKEQAWGLTPEKLYRIAGLAEGVVNTDPRQLGNALFSERASKVT